jgi:hypothetical protein
LISDQVRMTRSTAARTRTSDDIKASDHTTRTACRAVVFVAPGNDDTYERSRHRKVALGERGAQDLAPCHKMKWDLQRAEPKRAFAVRFFSGASRRPHPPSL